MGDDELVSIIRGLSGPVAVAIDAPLVVPNETGRRECEAEVQRVYGSRHAGPHPANRTLLTKVHGRIRGEDLLVRLRDLGFRLPADRGPRTVLECFPHPALIEMFGLSERLRYKAKRGFGVAHRRRGLVELDRLIGTLATATPPLRTPSLRIDETVRGRALKALEDRLDASICAWIAAAWTHGGSDAIAFFGDPAGAHIAVPRGTAQPTG